MMADPWLSDCVWFFSTLIANRGWLSQVIAARFELFGFLVVFTIFLMCASFFASAIFGHKLRYFHNVPSAAVSLIRLSVGILVRSAMSSRELCSAA